MKGTRVRAGLIVFVTAAFLVSGAQAAVAVADPGAVGATGVEQVAGAGTTGTQQAAGAGTTGAQQAVGACPTPRLTGLPKRPKFTNATIHFKLVNMTVGAVYVIRAGRTEALSKAAQHSTEKNSFQLPDQGLKSRKIPIEVVVSSDQCENGLWKLTKKIRYKAVTPPAPATPPANQPATPAPNAATPPPKAATPTPTPIKPAKVKPFNPVSALPKLPPKGPSLSLRAWMTPLDSGSRVERAPVGPKLSRIEQKTDKANSSAALVGLGALFVIVGSIAIVGLAVLRRRDDIGVQEAFDVLPQHLEEGSPDMPQAGEEPATAGFAAHMMTGAPPVTADQIPGANGNGAPSPAEHRAQIEAELQRLLTEAGIDAQLDGILAEAKEEAELQGITIDPDLMLRALSDGMNGAEPLSEASRASLRAMFQEIIAEETEQVTQQAS
jgi:hypothetical protein